MKYESLNQSQLTAEQLKMLNDINLKCQNKEIKLLNNIYQSCHNKNIRWMTSPLFSRDPIQSKFFSDLKFLNLVDYYVKKKKIKYIYVENFFLKKIIKKKHKHIKVFLNSHSIKSLILSFLNNFLSLIKIILFSIFMILAKNKKRKKNIINKEIILIETFFIKNLIYQNKYQERYHKKLFKKFSYTQRKESYFFPINLSIFSIFKFLRITKKESMKFIHILDYLKPKDYLKSIFF